MQQHWPLQLYDIMIWGHSALAIALGCWFMVVGIGLRPQPKACGRPRPHCYPIIMLNRNATGGASLVILISKTFERAINCAIVICVMVCFSHFVVKFSVCIKVIFPAIKVSARL